jgi:peptidoglycan/LPS O-acetylase OafA/YrhL
MTPTVADLGRAARGHLPALDGLRGLAIVLVLGHAFDLVPASTGAATAVGQALDRALDLGWIGVQLFFVLSGFLITGLLVDATGDPRRPRYYRDFFVRRVLRIFPLYYAALIVAYVVLPLVVTPPPGHGAHQLWLWTYLSNFAAPLGAAEAAFPHVWSLAVEEQFYLVWPIAVRLLVRRDGRALAGLCAAMVLLAVVARVLVRADLGAAAAYSFTPCRMDALAVGALAALAVRSARAAAWLVTLRPGRVVAAGAGLILAALAAGKLARTGAVMQTVGYGVIAAGGAVLLLGVVLDGVRGGPTARALGWAPLRAIGRYSYGMYVFHAPLHLFVGLPLLARYAPTPSLAVALGYVAAATAVTVATAALSFHLFERPFLALKDRLAPRPAAEAR